MRAQVLGRAGYVSHQVGKWHIGFFDHEHVPVGRGFATSFGYMLGASSHDNRSSQVSHTCGVPVKDLYNSTRIANDAGGYGFNNIFSAEMYGECLGLSPTSFGPCSSDVSLSSCSLDWNIGTLSRWWVGVQGASRARS